MKFVAFLRGVNVGGNIISMKEVKKVLETEGLTNVQTLLASGNVFFESNQKDSRKLTAKIESAFEKKFGRKIRTIVRPIHDIRKLADADPFKGIEVTKDTRLYVTFLHASTKNHLKTINKFFRVVKTCPFAVCTVLVLTPNHGSLDLMGLLEKHYGRDVTTRNWNTVQKILKASG